MVKTIILTLFLFASVAVGLWNPADPPCNRSTIIPGVLYIGSGYDVRFDEQEKSVKGYLFEFQDRLFNESYGVPFRKTPSQAVIKGHRYCIPAECHLRKILSTETYSRVFVSYEEVLKHLAQSLGLEFQEGMFGNSTDASRLSFFKKIFGKSETFTSESDDQSILYQLNVNNPLLLTRREEFAFDIRNATSFCQLWKDTNYTAYTVNKTARCFIDFVFKWGTHFIESAEFGGKFNLLVRGNTTRFSIVYQNVTDSSGNNTQVAKKTASLHEISRSQMKRVKTAINGISSGEPVLEDFQFSLVDTNFTVTGGSKELKSNLTDIFVKLALYASGGILNSQDFFGEDSEDSNIIEEWESSLVTFPEAITWRLAPMFEFFPEEWQSEMENDTNYLIEQAAKPPEQPAQVQMIERSPFYITVRWFKPIDNSALIFQYEVSIGPHGIYGGHGNPKDYGLDYGKLTNTTIVVPSTTLNFTFTGLDPFTYYNITLVARNRKGPSVNSADNFIQTLNFRARGIRNVTAVTGKRNVTITWLYPLDNGRAITTFEITAPARVSLFYTVDPTVLDLVNYTHYEDRLAPATSYFVFIKSYSGTEEADSAIRVDYTTLPAEPEPPYDLSLVDRNTTAIFLGWFTPRSNGRPILYYNITVYQIDPPGVNFTTTSRTDSKHAIALPSGTDFIFSMTAINQIGESLPSELFSASTMWEVPGIVVPNVTATKHTVLIVWDALTVPGKPVTIYYTVQSSGGNCNGTLTSCFLSGLTAGDTYFFDIWAFHVDGSGPITRYNFTTDPDVPGAITDLRQTGTFQNQISLEWTIPPAYGRAITNYTITYIPIDPLNTTSTTFTIPAPAQGAYIILSLDSGTLYNISMFAINEVGNGNISNVLTANTDWEAPVSVRGLNVTVLTSRTILVDYVTVIPSGRPLIQEYRILVNISGVLQNVSSTFTSAAQRYSINIGDLIPGTTYQVQVATIRGPSNVSVSIIISTPSDVPDSVPSIAQSFKGFSFVSINWIAPESNGRPITYYSLNLTAIDPAGGGSTIFNTTGISFNFTGLRNSTKYRVYIIAFNSVGGSNPSFLDIVTRLPAPPDALITFGNATNTTVPFSAYLPTFAGYQVPLELKVEWPPVYEFVFNGFWGDGPFNGTLTDLTPGKNTTVSVRVFHTDGLTISQYNVMTLP